MSPENYDSGRVRSSQISGQAKARNTEVLGGQRQVQGCLTILIRVENN